MSSPAQRRRSEEVLLTRIRQVGSLTMDVNERVNAYAIQILDDLVAAGTLTVERSADGSQATYRLARERG